MVLMCDVREFMRNEGTTALAPRFIVAPPKEDLTAKGECLRIE